MGAVDEVAKLGFEAAELLDGVVDLFGAVNEEVQDVAAGCLAVVAHGDDAADLAEREADGLR